MRRLICSVFLSALGLSAVGVSAPAHAQGYNLCEAFWVTRNMMFDRAGYCFGSVLGQSLFDNSDCTTTTPPPLPPEYAEAVTRIRGDEGRIGCAINTGVPAWGSIRAMFNDYNRFWTVPEPLDGGYACWGYTGPTVTLYAGADRSTPVMGELRSGLSWSTGHWGLPGWSFVTVSTGPSGQELATGWAASADFSGSTCDLEAG